MSRESEKALREAEEHLRKARVARFRGSLMNRRHADAEVRRAAEIRHDAGRKLLDALEALYLSVPCEACGAEVDRPCFDLGRNHFRPRSPRNPHPSRKAASEVDQITEEVEAALNAASLDD